jgi:hypothetical protein
MTLLLFALWISINTLLVSIGIELGWGFDPGYVGPMLLVIVLHLTVALYSARRSGS